MCCLTSHEERHDFPVSTWPIVSIGDGRRSLDVSADKMRRADISAPHPKTYHPKMSEGMRKDTDFVPSRFRVCFLHMDPVPGYTSNYDRYIRGTARVLCKHTEIALSECPTRGKMGLPPFFPVRPDRNLRVGISDPRLLF